MVKKKVIARTRSKIGHIRFGSAVQRELFDVGMSEVEHRLAVTIVQMRVHIKRFELIWGRQNEALVAAQLKVEIVVGVEVGMGGGAVAAHPQQSLVLAVTNLEESARRHIFQQFYKSIGPTHFARVIQEVLWRENAERMSERVRRWNERINSNQAVGSQVRSRNPSLQAFGALDW
jgi:hypothetical protein